MELLSGTHSKLGTPKDMGDLAVLVKEGDVKSDLIKPEKEDFVNSDIGLTNGSGIGFPPGTGGGEVDVNVKPPAVAGLDGQQQHSMVNSHPPPPGPTPADQLPPGHMMGSGPGPGPQPPQRGGGQFIPPESPFMQQHSQIFVFSTDLANQAAAAVCQGMCKSIIDFHLDQPGIKDMLQKQPMKLLPPVRPPMQSGMFPGMRPDGHMAPGGPMMKGVGPPVMGPGGPGEPDMSSVEQWVQQQNNHLQQGNYQQMAMQQMGANNQPPNNPYMQPVPGMPSWPPESISPHGLSSGDEYLAGPHQMVGPGGPHPMGGQGGFGPGGPPQHMMGGGGPHMNLQQNKVPNENLTPEQLQRREDRLAHIRKLQMMLLPEQQPPTMPGGLAGDMMGPGGPMMGGPQPGGPMMGPPMDMMGPPMDMMGGPMPHGQPPGSMPPFGGGGMRGLPPNWENLSMEQREWYKVQHEFYVDKMRKQQMESMHFGQMQPMGMGPQRHPSPFYPGMPQHRGLIDSMSPASPNFNGPMPPHPGLDPRGMSPMPGEPPDFMRPGMQPRPMPGGHMNNFPPGMPSMHPVGFDPTMEPSITDFMFPPDDMVKMGGSGPMMRGLPPMMRAGNPEQFHPELVGPGGMHVNGPKVPPTYGHKRKRSGEDMDELYKKLQPAPSPQQFSYLNQFEGQELTITRQLNLAYHESPQNNILSQQPLTPAQLSTSDQQQQQQQQTVQSPASRNGTGALNHGTPASAASPLAITTSASSRPSSVNVTLGTSLPISSSSSAVGVQQQTTALHRTISHDGSGQHMPATSKSSLTSNITSSSLEKLAKGVEQLSNQMQQSMSQGGPFHNVQVHTPNSSDMPSTPASVSQAPPVSNLPMNAPQMSNQGHPMPTEQQLMGIANQSPLSMAGQPAQGQNHAGYMSGSNGFDPRFETGIGGSRPMPLPGGNGGLTPPMGSGFAGSPQSGMLSPGYQRPLPSNTIGNANVQIQPKAPNTIQYMPVTNASGSVPMNRLPQMMMKDFDMPPRMPSPGMDRPMMGKRNSYSPGPPDLMMGPGPRMPIQGQPQMGIPPQMMMQGGGGMPYGSPGPVPVHMQGRPPSPMMNCPPEMYPMPQQHMPMPGGGGMMMGPGGPIRPDMIGPGMGGPNGSAGNGGPSPGYSYQYQQFQQQLYAQNRPRPYGPGMGGPGMGGMMGVPMGRPDMMEPDMGPSMMMGMGGGRMMGPGGPPMGMNMLPNMP